MTHTHLFFSYDVRVYVRPCVHGFISPHVRLIFNFSISKLIYDDVFNLLMHFFWWRVCVNLFCVCVCVCVCVA